LSYAEIADELDVPLGTIKARIHQARKAVAERLTVH
jgi:RNA polymerase sigma-70 factor (ECF subfamily)